MIRASLSIADEATPELRRMAAQLARPEALYKDVGRRAANELRRHYKERDAAQSNRLGGKRTHFWADVRDGVQQPQLRAGGVEVVIQHYAILQKIYGGRITAKNRRMLTIPIHALAHGRRASVFEGETGKTLFRPKGSDVLLAKIGSEVRAIYALRRSVSMRPDPKALPAAADLSAALLATAQAHLSRALARGS